MLVRSLAFQLAAYLNFLVHAVLPVPLLLLKEDHAWPFARFWVRSTLWLHRTICRIDDDIRGLENIPSGGFLVASKHQSSWETLRLIELFPRPAFILKRPLLRVPIFGWFLAKFGMVPVDRGKGSEAIEAMIRRARQAIAEGRQIIIFPEGTRRPPLASAEYRHGLARLYGALDVPCLPIALNSGLFWPRRSLIHRPGTILLQILPAIPPGRPPEVVAAAVKEQIEAASAGLLEEAFDRQPALRALALAEMGDLER